MFELYGLQRKGTKKKFFLNKLNPIKMVFYLKSENYESKTLSSELIQIVIPFIHKRHGIFFYSLNHVKMHLSCTRIGVALSLCVFFFVVAPNAEKKNWHEINRGDKFVSSMFKNQLSAVSWALCRSSSENENEMRSWCQTWQDKTDNIRYTIMQNIVCLLKIVQLISSIK